MAKSAKGESLVEDIRKALKKELAALDAMSGADNLTSRMAVVNTAIKFEAMTAKLADTELGSGFRDDD